MNSRQESEGEMESYRARGSAPPSLLPVITPLIRARRTIAVIVFAGALVGVAVILLRPRHYTTTFSFVPQGAGDQTRSGLASLAGQFGVSLGGAAGQSQSPQFYADLVQTREILGALAADSVRVPDAAGHPVATPTFLGVDISDPAERRDETIRVLRGDVIGTSVATRTTGVITVTVRTRSAGASLAIANRLIDGLNRFNLQTRQSQAASERRFIEGRLADARGSLRAAEDALQRFLQGNRIIGTAPALAFQRDRLERDVAVQQQLVAGLVQQYEDARIREVRDTQVITTIERPVQAARPDSRRALPTLLAAMSAAFFAALAFVLGREALRPLREELASESGEPAVRVPAGASPARSRADVSEHASR